MRRLGIIADCIIEKSPVATLEAIKETGFDCFFTHRTDEATVAALKEKADILSLDFEFIHGPYHGCNVMWEENDSFRPFLDDVLRSIRVAAKYGVKTIIAHVSSGWTPPPITPLGLERFDVIVQTAQENGVNIAFENLRRLDNFSAVMQRYQDAPNVGFCYDVGHEHCYTQNVAFVDHFGDRLLCTHFHDNLGFEGNKTGNDDMHVLPFDGNIDFSTVMKKLNNAQYRGSIMLEAFNGSPYGEAGFPDYKNLSDIEFLSIAYDRAKRLNNM